MEDSVGILDGSCQRQRTARATGVPSQELRSIRQAAATLIDAAPLDDGLNIILASIEGAPDTPYEKGIFWIIVQLSHETPGEALCLRFVTRIYHPNVDCEGKVGAEYPDLGQIVRLWFFGESPAGFLGSLLTALCSLPSSPAVDDPIVPEIAGTHMQTTTQSTSEWPASIPNDTPEPGSRLWRELLTLSKGQSQRASLIMPRI